MPQKDYYKILDISKNASPEEIKKAFRKLAHQYHPDKKGGDEKKFKEVSEAYQVLGNAEKRAQYDQFGKTFDQQGGFGSGMGWDDFMRHAREGNQQTHGFENGFSFDLGDMFGDLFGFGGRRNQKTRQSRGADIEISVKLSFEESLRGTEKEFEIQKKQKCSRCNGNGAEPGTPITACKTCGGQGQVRRVQQTILGSMQTVVACSDCQGEGKRCEIRCKECGASGIVNAKQNIRVKIPAGINHGETIRLSQNGEAGYQGGPSGDLYIQVRVEKDSHFRREGYDIFTQEEISFSQAVLGDTIRVRTVDGEVKLKIPDGTPSRSIFKLKGKGVQHLHSSHRGDHYVETNIRVPRKISRTQKQLLEEFKKEEM